MASAKKHQKQYENNRILINNLLEQPKPPNDWIVTIAFYSALHLVDKAIVTSGEEHKPKDHDNRNRKVGILANLKPIRRYYQALYMESRKSRYDCVSISDQSRDTYVDCLKEIERRLNK